MKIGILGGTFDPVHLGHLALAQAAVSNLGLDKLIFIPSMIPPHKTRKDIASPQDRLQMIKLAIEGYSKYEISDYEISRGGTSFSYETVMHFKKAYPDDSLFLIIGADSYNEFSTWKNQNQIRKVAKLAVAQRPSYTYGPLGKDAVEIRMEPSSVSSYEIRSKVRRGEPIADLVPGKVKDYIISKRLYANLDNY